MIELTVADLIKRIEKTHSLSDKKVIEIFTELAEVFTENNSGEYAAHQFDSLVGAFLTHFIVKMIEILKLNSEHLDKKQFFLHFHKVIINNNLLDKEI